MRNFLNLIIERVPRNFVTSIDPDLPNLLYGPKLLIGGEGRLFAFFISRPSDEAQTLARLTLSRLVLPSHTKCILMVDGNESYTFSKIYEHFHATINEKDDLRHLEYLFHDSDLGPNIRIVPENIRHYVSERAGYLLSEDWKENAFGYAPANLNETTKYKEMKVYQDSVYYAEYHSKNIRRKKSLREQLRDFSVPLLQETFKLDRGVPYPNIAANLFVSDSITGRSDGMVASPCIAAAYAGGQFYPQ